MSGTFYCGIKRILHLRPPNKKMDVTLKRHIPAKLPAILEICSSIYYVLVFLINSWWSYYCCIPMLCSNSKTWVKIDQSDWWISSHSISFRTSLFLKQNWFSSCVVDRVPHNLLLWKVWGFCQDDFMVFKVLSPPPRHQWISSFPWMVCKQIFLYYAPLQFLLSRLVFLFAYWNTK